MRRGDADRSGADGQGLGVAGFLEVDREDFFAVDGDLTWGLDAEAQWLANRGYLCVNVNFRGSSGYGKDFLNAGDREWGAKMHNDLLDAINHLVGQGIVDRERVAIYGGSYGGYAALIGATFTPDVFKCAISMVGPSNLNTLIDSAVVLILALVVVISARGLQGGIEPANKIRAPALLVLLLILVVYALSTGDVRRGLTFAFKPDFSAVNAQVVLSAIGQAFYATGVGQAMMIAFGAYIERGTSLVRTSLVITGSILAVSLLATMLALPAVPR